MGRHIAGRVRPRRFEIRFLDRGAAAYAFTFGRPAQHIRKEIKP